MRLIISVDIEEAVYSQLQLKIKNGKKYQALPRF